MLTYEGPDTRYSLTELGELMLELAQAEDLDLDTALDRAAAQLDELHSYVYDWDRAAQQAERAQRLQVMWYGPGTAV